MIAAHACLLFVGACCTIIVVPGPAQALVVAKTLAGGGRAGVVAAIGLNLGTLLHSVAAAAGLSALLAASASAFAAIKFAGAAYLVHLGIRALRSSTHAPGRAPESTAPVLATLRQAFAVGVLNPKVALFFLAFLPPFVDTAQGHVFAQFVLLGATMALLDVVYESLIVAVVCRMRGRHAPGARVRAWPPRICGAVLVALGVRLALAER